MTRKYFGTDGIRGQANSFPMTADMAMKAAMATACVLRARHPGQPTQRAVVGKDTRLSCYMLEQAVTAGFLSMGMDVILTGPVPTPGISMLTRSLRADVGVMISASHNSFEDNGIKLFGADGRKLEDEIEREIEAKMDNGLADHLAAPDALGKAARLDDVIGRYAESLKRSLPRGESLDGLKIVLDCANGAGYKVGPQVLWELEADVIAIGVEPNGRNINAGYGATATENLQKSVVEHQADVGVALDGDGDRLIMVDEQGRKIDGDQLMGCLALSMQSSGNLKGDALVATVMSNLGLERMLSDNGIKLIRTGVGDRYVSEAMREGGYNLGGEQSGHIIMSDYGCTGDGLVAALNILAIIKSAGKKASEVLNIFEPVPQILRSVRYSAGAPLEAEAVKEAIEQAEKTLANDGRILVRASGTEPVIRVMAEGDDQQSVENVVENVCSVIEKIAS